MAPASSYFPTRRSLNSSDEFSTTNHIGSGSLRLMTLQQKRLLLEAQQRNIMVKQERLRQLRSLASTVCIKPWTNVQNYYVGPAHRIPSMMPQPYDIDGRKRKWGFVPIANPNHVSGHAQPATTHLAMSKHAWNNTTFAYNYQNFKRKCITTDVPTRSSTSVVLQSTINVPFNFDKNCQEVQMLMENKKNTTMTPSLIDGNDVAEREAREIQLFPRSLNHGRPSNDSEFSMYEMSSVLGDRVDVDLDLSLNLCSSGRPSDIRVDLSLKL